MRIVLETVRCAWCHEEFGRPLSTPGRPRKYCTDECRRAYVKNVAQPAWLRREKRKRIGRSVW
ncbi:hypothetical protein QFZ66_002025 [Streptomyces sp. B4I13]|nr:hypothetical protein [Streptomyces sp. B4I13]